MVYTEITDPTTNFLMFVNTTLNALKHVLTPAYKSKYWTHSHRHSPTLMIGSRTNKVGFQVFHLHVSVKIDDTSTLTVAETNSKTNKCRSVESKLTPELRACLEDIFNYGSTQLMSRRWQACDLILDRFRVHGIPNSESIISMCNKPKEGKNDPNVVDLGLFYLFALDEINRLKEEHVKYRGISGFTRWYTDPEGRTYRLNYNPIATYANKVNVTMYDQYGIALVDQYMPTIETSDGKVKHFL